MMIYMMFIIYYLIIEIQLISQLKLKYFKEFWSYVQLGMIICSWLSIGVYIWRYKESKRISELFHETNGYVYINLQLSAYVIDPFNCLYFISYLFPNFYLVQVSY